MNDVKKAKSFIARNGEALTINDGIEYIVLDIMKDITDGKGVKEIKCKCEILNSLTKAYAVINDPCA